MMGDLKIYVNSNMNKDRLFCICYNNKEMDEQDQYIFEDEALKIFSLFPKRDIKVISPSPKIFAKLFDSLTCTICREIYSNPVYLKCSHRFCKECIEKYIRSNNKKSCPNCRGGLTTKRDLRLDYNLQSLINYAYGDANKLMKKIEDLDRQQISNNRTFQLNRMQSLSQSKKRNKSEVFEDNMGMPTAKKIKSNQGEEIRRKRQDSSKKSQIKIQSKQEISLSTKNIPVLTEQTKKSIKEPEKNIIISRKKSKNQVQVIEILESEEQVEEIPKEQFFHHHEVNQSKFCSIKMIPEVSEYQTIKNFSSFHEEIKQTSLQGQEQNKQKIISTKQIQNHIQNQQKFQREKEITLTKHFLREQFGQLFITKLIQLTNFDIYAYITIQQYPNPFIPPLQFKTIKISSKATVQSILILIAESLNTPKQSIKTFINEGGDYLQLNCYLKIYELNERYWRQNEGFQLLELADEIKLSNVNKERFRTQKKVIYFLVDYNKILI